MQNKSAPTEPEKDTDKNTQQIGKNMMTIAWIIAIILATWLFGGWEKKQINPNMTPVSQTSEKVTEVTLKRNRYGHYLATGTINHTPVTFFLDTGATDVAIPGELQNTLQLATGTGHHVQTANGTTTAYSTTIDTLQIGQIKLYNVKASIVPNMKGEEVLLGMSVLKQLEFTQKGNQLNLRQNH